MATFSIYALEAMGFKETVQQGGLVACFTSVTVYEVRGITLPEGFSEVREACVAGTNYRIALSKGVNSGCQRLIGDDFTDSETEWLKEVKSSGPFVLVAVGPTDFVECEAGRVMRMPDGNLTTYDSFPSVRERLTSLEDRVLPPVIAALTLALNKPDRYVSLRKVARGSAGRTSDGTTVHDIRLDAHFAFSVSRPLEAIQAIEAFDCAVERIPTLHRRAAKLFALGTAEDDQLKRFLHFFLSLEVETRAVFGRIDHASSFESLMLRGGTQTTPPNVAVLITRDISKWENLFDQFVWCATCSWTGLNEDDIKLFKELKSVRDSIAHGRISDPPSGTARQAELLAHKILWP